MQSDAPGSLRVGVNVVLDWPSGGRMDEPHPRRPTPFRGPQEKNASGEDRAVRASWGHRQGRVERRRR
jgi:hypothetical protein